MNTEHRKILIINGDYSQSIEQCQIILQGHTALWISDQSIDSVNTLPYKKTRTQLGQENSIIVFDAIRHFDANALGASKV